MMPEDERWVLAQDVPSVEDAPYCGVYWIITTCLTGIAIGIWLGMVLWLILGEHR